jgi:GH15 family glucan-1,4-alpha-glucosidase
LLGNSKGAHDGESKSCLPALKTTRCWGIVIPRPWLEEAKRLFERLLELRNDVGLLSEEYDPRAKRLVGNFPQAFSHVGLINTALNLTHEEGGPAEHRRQS